MPQSGAFLQWFVHVHVQRCKNLEHFKNGQSLWLLSTSKRLRMVMYSTASSNVESGAFLF